MSEYNPTVNCTNPLNASPVSLYFVYILVPATDCGRNYSESLAVRRNLYCLSLCLLNYLKFHSDKRQPPPVKSLTGLRSPQYEEAQVGNVQWSYEKRHIMTSHP